MASNISQVNYSHILFHVSSPAGESTWYVAVPNTDSQATVLVSMAPESK